VETWERKRKVTKGNFRLNENRTVLNVGQIPIAGETRWFWGVFERKKEGGKER